MIQIANNTMKFDVELDLAVGKAIISGHSDISKSTYHKDASNKTGLVEGGHELTKNNWDIHSEFRVDKWVKDAVDAVSTEVKKISSEVDSFFKKLGGKHQILLF
jgi:hypothetical protein